MQKTGIKKPLCCAQMAEKLLKMWVILYIVCKGAKQESFQIREYYTDPSLTTEELHDWLVKRITQVSVRLIGSSFQSIGCGCCQYRFFMAFWLVLTRTECLCCSFLSVIWILDQYVFSSAFSCFVSAHLFQIWAQVLVKWVPILYRILPSLCPLTSLLVRVKQFVRLTGTTADEIVLERDPGTWSQSWMYF